MSVLLDTSIIIDVLREHPVASEYLLKLPETPTCSEITRVEVLRGLRSEERGPTERLFARLRWVVVDETITRRAGEIGRSWRRSHPGISTADLVIAASAQERGLKLATANVKHFPMFRGLRPPYRD